MHPDTIPTLDLGSLRFAGGRARLDAACREWGVFHLVNHGIDGGLTTMLLRQSRRFFEQPVAFKRRIERTAGNPWGYYDRELTRHTPDWKQVFDFGPPDGAAIRPQWPAGMPAFKAAIEAYYAACDALALALVSAVSVNLGVNERHLQGCFRPLHTSFLRLNYYPRSTDGGALHMGVHPHTDAGALTILLQDDQPGLEVFRQGTWHVVAPRRDSLVVNLGDIVQVWSNDRYPAALHRATVGFDAERFSAPFFFNPSYAVDYAPLPTVIDAEHPPRYRPINWGEFRARRTAGDYANPEAYAQIADYVRG